MLILEDCALPQWIHAISMYLDANEKSIHGFWNELDGGPSHALIMIY